MDTLTVTVSPFDASTDWRAVRPRRESTGQRPVQRSLLGGQCPSPRAFRHARHRACRGARPRGAGAGVARRRCRWMRRPAGSGRHACPSAPAQAQNIPCSFDSPPGTPAAPLSAADLASKAVAAFASAVVPMSATHADKHSFDAVNSFESCPDASALIRRQAREPDHPIASTFARDLSMHTTSRNSGASPPCVSLAASLVARLRLWPRQAAPTPTSRSEWSSHSPLADRRTCWPA